MSASLAGSDTPTDCRASLRHYKVVDGSDALPDENTQERQYRDGAARPGLQHETGDAHSGRRRTNGSDPNIRSTSRGTWSRPPTLIIRVFTQSGSKAEKLRLGKC